MRTGLERVRERERGRVGTVMGSRNTKEDWGRQCVILALTQQTSCHAQNHYILINHSHNTTTPHDISLFPSDTHI